MTDFVVGVIAIGVLVGATLSYSLALFFHRCTVDELTAERNRLQVQRDDLLFAARPLAEKTTWSFMGTGPQVRMEEVKRNAQAEHLRRTIEGITGATLRPEDLSEVPKIDISRFQTEDEDVSSSQPRPLGHLQLPHQDHPHEPRGSSPPSKGRYWLTEKAEDHLREHDERGEDA